MRGCIYPVPSPSSKRVLRYQSIYLSVNMSPGSLWRKSIDQDFGYSNVYGT